MLFQESLSSHPDDGSCDLYVHLQPKTVLFNLEPVRSWLMSEYKATQIFPNSFYIASDYLYEENNADSFIEDFLNYLGPADPGFEFVVCPTSGLQSVSFESDASEE